MGGGLSGLFGKKSSEQKDLSGIHFDQGDLDKLRGAQSGAINSAGQVGSLATDLSGQARQAGAPTLGTNFNQFQNIAAFNPGQAGLDQLGKQLVSQGTQGLQAQAGAQGRAFQQALGGQPGAGNVLAQQAASRARLQANPLLFQAAEGSVGRGQQGFQNLLGLAGQQVNAQQAGNQALLQQQESGTANRAEQLQLQNAAFQTYSQLAPILAQIAQLTGQRFGNSQGSATEFGFSGTTTKPKT